MSESRIQEWVYILQALTKMGGELEQTKIVPNCEIMDITPANLPAGYVLVKDKNGYQIPAVVVAGLTVAVGDLVNVLYITGTEAIVLTQGSGSSSGNGGWPYDKVITVDPTNANADYATITLAAAGAVANDCILVGNKTSYAEANITLPADTSLVFFDNYFVQLVNTTNVHTLILQGNTIHRLNVYANLSNVNPVYAIECGNTYTILNECQIRADNTNANDGTADAYAVYTVDGEVVLRDCEVIATCSCATAHAYPVAIKNGGLYDCYLSGGARGYGLYVYADGDVNVYGGFLSGTRGGLYVEAGATVRLCNLPRIEGGVTNLGTIEGMWIDENGRFCAEGSQEGSLLAGLDATHAMDLLAVGVDGRYLKANSAVALGLEWSVPPGGTGWPFSKVLTVDPTDPDADYNDFVTAWAASVNGDVFLLGAGTHNLSAACSVPAGETRTVVGFGRKDCILVGLANTAFFSVGAGSSLRFHDLQLQHDQTGPGGLTASILATGATGTIDFYDVDFTVTPVVGVSGFALSSKGGVIARSTIVVSGGAGLTGTSCAVSLNAVGSTLDIYDSRIECDPTSSTTRYALWIVNGTLNLFDTRLDGGTENALTIAAGGVGYLDGMQVEAGTVTNAGSLYGSYQDSVGKTQFIAGVAINEFSSDGTMAGNSDLAVPTEKAVVTYVGAHTGGITGLANPSASIGLAAVNGAATTAIRSDGAPALSQAIAPTWTGAHIWKKAADSVTGWQVQDQDGNIILDVDSVNNRFGIGTAAPGANLEVYGADAIIRLNNISIGGAVIAQTMPGLCLSANGMSATNQYTAAIKFTSIDPQFTTTNPKFLAGIVGRATQTYNDDSDSGMGIDFLTTPNDAGVAPTPSVVATLDQNGKFGLGMAPSYTIDVAGNIRCSTGFGCNSKTPQTAYASGGALAAYGAGANGLDSGANMSALHALIVAMRAALVANGIMS